jgi:4-nitrophenyl phosphatase
MTADRKISTSIRNASSSESEMSPAGGFIFDIDGTLALGNSRGKSYDPIPGARELLDRLNASETPTIAYTNGTLHTPEEYRKTLWSIGLEFAPDHIITPASVAADYFKRRSIRRVLVLGAEGVSAPLEKAGLTIVRPNEPLDGVQAVLVGWFPAFTFPDLEAACRAVWAGAALFSVSNAPFFAARGGRMLGISGAIAAMVHNVTGRRATLIGKPAVHGVRIACARMGLRASNVVVVGDDPTLEISMARRAGARAVGVLTGIGDREAFHALPRGRAPHLILNSVADLLSSGLAPAPGGCDKNEAGT